MRKKKKIVEEPIIDKVDTPVEETVIIPTIYSRYIVKLEKKYESYKPGKTLDAILMPFAIDRANDVWENKWYVYDGDVFLGRFPLNTDILTVVSFKKEKKGRG